MRSEPVTTKESQKRSLFQRLFYRFLRTTSRLLVVGLCDFRTVGRENIPDESGGLVLSNHQSVMDPVLIGLVVNRRLNYLARKTLFKNRIFAWLITVLDAIEINRDGSGLAGLKETLKRLKRDELVLIFPEGTRTKTGELQPLKNGFVSVARRSKQPLIPVALDGAFHVLSSKQLLPSRLPIAVVIGEPLLPEEVAALDDQGLVAELEARMSSAFSVAQSLVGSK